MSSNRNKDRDMREGDWTCSDSKYVIGGRSVYIENEII